jgi:biotin transport system ATP-binding protein
MAEHRNERVSELSGGERERVAIAGTLAMEPDYLVLDEPFTGLDGPARQSVVDHLATLKAQETGVVVVTHDPRHVLDLADRVVSLSGGEVILDASPTVARDRLNQLAVEVH